MFRQIGSDFVRRVRTAVLPVALAVAVSGASGDGLDCFARSLLASIDTASQNRGIEIIGPLAYVATGGSHFEIYDLSRPTQPELISSVPMPGGARAVAVDSGLAYVTQEGFGLRIVDVTDPYAPTLVAGLALPDSFFNINLDGELLLLTSVEGVTIVNIADPQNPVNLITWGVFGEDTFYAADLENGILCAGGIGWVGGTNLFIAAVDTEPFSIQFLTSIESDSIIHDIAMVGDLAYAIGYSLTVFDLSDPTSPVMIANIPTNDSAYDMDIVGDRIYVAADRAGLLVYDISDPRNPVPLSEYELFGQAIGVGSNGEIAVVADFLTGLHIMDVTVPKTSPLVNTLWLEEGSDTPFIEDNLLITGGTFRDMELVDITDPLSPVSQSVVPVDDTIYGVDRVGDLLFVAANEQYLRIYDIADPAAPILLSVLETPDRAIGIQVRDGFAYLGCDYAGLIVADVRDTANPKIVSSNKEPERAFRVLLKDEHVIVSSGNTLSFFDITDPANPMLVSTYTTGQYISFIQLRNDLLYLARDYITSAIEVIDISTIAKPELITIVPIGTRPYGMTILGDRLYFSEHSSVHVFDIANPTEPRFMLEYFGRVRFYGGFAVGNGYGFGVGTRSLYTIELGNCDCPADMSAPFGTLDFYDLQVFLSRFSEGDPGADLNLDGLLDINDVLAFLDGYAAGCG